MPSYKIDQPTLSSTLEGAGPTRMSDALGKFRAFIREEKDDNDDDDTKLDSEMDMEFILRTKAIGSLAGPELSGLGRDFFSPNFRLVLSNKSRRSALEEALKSEVKGGDAMQKVRSDLEQARKEVWDRCVGYHNEWVAKLLKDKVIEDRSGETIFNGWLV